LQKCIAYIHCANLGLWRAFEFKRSIGSFFDVFVNFEIKEYDDDKGQKAQKNQAHPIGYG